MQFWMETGPDGRPQYRACLGDEVSMLAPSDIAECRQSTMANLRNYLTNERGHTSITIRAVLRKRRQERADHSRLMLQSFEL